MVLRTDKRCYVTNEAAATTTKRNLDKRIKTQAYSTVYVFNSVVHVKCWDDSF